MYEVANKRGHLILPFIFIEMARTQVREIDVLLLEGSWEGDRRKY